MKNRKNNSERESLTSKILVPLGFFGFIALCAASMTWGEKSHVKKQTHHYAQKIGIYNKIDNIKCVSRPRDYNGDGWFDHLVQFKDGKTIIYHHKGYEKGNKDLSDKVHWGHMNHVSFREGVDPNQL